MNNASRRPVQRLHATVRRATLTATACALVVASLCALLACGSEESETPTGRTQIGAESSDAAEPITDADANDDATVPTAASPTWPDGSPSSDDASHVDAGEPQDASTGEPFLVAAYYADFSSTPLPVTEIRFGAFAQLHLFGARPTTTGGLSGTVDESIIAASHAAGRGVALTVGGAASQAEFESAISAEQRSAFVLAIVTRVATYGFDAVDLDMEPLNARDDDDFTAFVHELRAFLPPQIALTSTLQWELPMFAALASEIDRFELLSYHLIGDTDVT